jgi:flagellar assembly protein FliH
MSSRVVQGGESVRIEPVSWPASPSGQAGSIACREVEELRSTLAATLEELRVARGRIAELESALAGAEAAAHKRGVAEGMRAAQESAETQQKALLERISLAVADIASLRTRIREQAEADLVKLSLAIARRITHREMSIDPNALLGVVRSALSKIPVGELTKIRLHPSCAAVVRFQLESLRTPATVEVEADASLEPGDLLLETSGGLLDASIDTQLREIERGFCDRLRH